VLRGERADVTDFFLFSWPWWMGSVVKHNMLKHASRLVFPTNFIYSLVFPFTLLWHHPSFFSLEDY